MPMWGHSGTKGDRGLWGFVRSHSPHHAARGSVVLTCISERTLLGGGAGLSSQGGGHGKQSPPSPRRKLSSRQVPKCFTPVGQARAW